MTFFEKICYRIDITKYNYKKLSIFPLILVLLSVVIVSALRSGEKLLPGDGPIIMCRKMSL